MADDDDTDSADGSEGLYDDAFEAALSGSRETGTIEAQQRLLRGIARLLRGIRDRRRGSPIEISLSDWTALDIASELLEHGPKAKLFPTLAKGKRGGQSRSREHELAFEHGMRLIAAAEAGLIEMSVAKAKKAVKDACLVDPKAVQDRWLRIKKSGKAAEFTPPFHHPRKPVEGFSEDQLREAKARLQEALTAKLERASARMQQYTRR